MHPLPFQTRKGLALWRRIDRLCGKNSEIPKIVRAIILMHESSCSFFYGEDVTAAIQLNGSPVEQYWKDVVDILSLKMDMAEVEYKMLCGDDEYDITSANLLDVLRGREVWIDGINFSNSFVKKNTRILFATKKNYKFMALAARVCS